MKVLVLGHGGHGKDTVASLLEGVYGLKFTPTTEEAAKVFVYDRMKWIVNYKTIEECVKDRHNHRRVWANLFEEYTKHDRGRFVREVLKSNDMYVGLRDIYQFVAVRDMFDLIVWVDASKRLPLEKSMSIPMDCADVVIDNNGDGSNLRAQVVSLGDYFEKPCSFEEFVENFDTHYGVLEDFGEGVYRISTGGWSDNEYWISRLKDSVWWYNHWRVTCAGGHYYFSEFPKEVWKVVQHQELKT